MSEHLPNIDLASIEMNTGYQAIFIATNVKYNPPSDFIRRWEGHAQVTEILKLGMAHNLEPAGQRRLTNLCGPPAMVQAAIQMLKGLGVPEGRIAFDEF